MHPGEPRKQRTDKLFPCSGRVRSFHSAKYKRFRRAESTPQQRVISDYLSRVAITRRTVATAISVKPLV
jgi:hypothetical protein